MSRLFFIVLLCLISGCSILSPANNEPMHSYFLTDPVSNNKMTPRGEKTLLVSTFTAPQWLDTQGMVYILHPNEVDYFANHQWVSPPQQLLQPIVIHALSQSGKYRAVVSSPFSGNADENLDIRLINMQQNFCQKPSGYQIILQAQLINDEIDKPIAVRRFSVMTTAPSDDPQGGLMAANQAVKQVLPQIVRFCEQYG